MLEITTYDPKEFQKAATKVLELGIIPLSGQIIQEKKQHERVFDKPNDKSKAKEEVEPREPRLRWPKRVDAKPTATADDLPELFAEDLS